MYFLLIFNLFFCLFIYFLRNKNISYFKIITGSSLLIYIISVLFIQINKYEIENKMKRFDTNNDGFYSRSEINYEFSELETELITDSGSNLFIMFGYPISLIYFVFITSIYHLSNYLYIKIKN
jgi:hypothetical protein